MMPSAVAASDTLPKEEVVTVVEARPVKSVKRVQGETQPVSCAGPEKVKVMGRPAMGVMPSGNVARMAKVAESPTASAVPGAATS